MDDEHVHIVGSDSIVSYDFCFIKVCDDPQFGGRARAAARAAYEYDIAYNKYIYIYIYDNIYLIQCYT